MTRVKVRQLIWDEWNTKHIGKHNVSTREAEEAGKKIIYHKKAKYGRYLLIGRSGKRLLAIVINKKSRGRYYTITARDASKKERKRVYEKEKQNTKI